MSNIKTRADTQSLPLFRGVVACALALSALPVLALPIEMGEFVSKPSSATTASLSRPAVASARQTEALLDAIFADMPPNSFKRINENQISDVWTPENKRVQGRLGAGYESRIPGILNAWGGVAWNPDLGQILAFGGGHFSYPGNEPYYFSLVDRRWHRGCLPSDIIVDRQRQHIFPVIGPATAVANYPPPSTHSYDKLNWLPWLGKYLLVDPSNFFAFTPHRYGGTNLSDTSHLVKTGPYLLNPALFDEDKVCGQSGTGVDAKDSGLSAWENRDWPQTVGISLSTRSVSVDASSRTVYVLKRGRDELIAAYFSENGKSDTFSSLGGTIGTSTTIGGSAYIPHLRSIIYASQKAVFIKSIDFKRNYDVIIPIVNLSKPDAPLLSYDAGFDYDPDTKVATLWQGGEHGQSVVWELSVPERLSSVGWLLRKNIASTGPKDGPELINGKWVGVGPGRFFGVRDGEVGEVWAYKLPEQRPRGYRIISKTDIKPESKLRSLPGLTPKLVLPFVEGEGGETRDFASGRQLDISPGSFARIDGQVVVNGGPVVSGLGLVKELTLVVTFYKFPTEISEMQGGREGGAQSIFETKNGQSILRFDASRGKILGNLVALPSALSPRKSRFNLINMAISMGGGVRTQICLDGHQCFEGQAVKDVNLAQLHIFHKANQIGQTRQGVIFAIYEGRASKSQLKELSLNPLGMIFEDIRSDGQ